jgi:predicted enzyme related to lactoylglutathione lyase
VSLWQPRSRIGATLVNDIGARCWNELATTDVGRAKMFFAELLGWEYETDDGGYVSIKNVGSLNGGMREHAEQERGIPPNWISYFTVEAADEAARQAVQLGGRMLLQTTEIHFGRLAVIADPQGAAFAQAPSVGELSVLVQRRSDSPPRFATRSRVPEKGAALRPPRRESPAGRPRNLPAKCVPPRSAGPRSVLKPPQIGDISKTSTVRELRRRPAVCRQLAPHAISRSRKGPLLPAFLL